MTNFSRKNLDNAKGVGRETEYQDDASQRGGLPEGWGHVQLGDAIDYGKCEKLEPALISDDSWVLELEDIERDSSKVIQFLTFANRQSKSTKNKFKKGDVLYGKLRPYLNKVVVASSDGVCTTEIIPLNGGKFVNNKFIFYWLKTAEFLTYVTAVGYGVNMPRLGTEDGKAAPFVLAPLAEQQQIAQKLDELLAQVDTLKTRLDSIPKILKRFRQSVLAAAVSGRLTEEWRAVRNIKLTVGEYECAILKDNFKPKFASNIPVIETENGWLKLALGQLLTVSSGDGLTSKEMQEGNIPVYGGNGINGYHHEANFTERKVVIGRVGFYCGSVHFTQERSWVTDNALVVNFPQSLVNLKFIYNLLRATNLREDSASTAQPVISGSKIYPIELMLPSLEEQTEIVRRVEQLFAYADQIEQRVKDAQTRVNHLTQSILAKAFRGELTAEWRAQNPALISGENSAAALLERIKAEREAAVKPKRKVKA